MQNVFGETRWGCWRHFALIAILLSVVPVGAAQPLPDLAVVDLAVEPEPIETGRPAEMVVTIANEGRSSLLRSFNVDIRVGTELMHSGRVSTPLQPNQSIEVSGTWDNPTEGEHRVRVRADPFDRVDEADEENNELRTTLTVQPPQSVRSITDPLLEAIAGGLIEAGQALEVEHTSDTFQLISNFEAAFESIATAYRQSVRTMAAIVNPAPDPFQTMPQVTRGERILELYDTMAEDFQTAKTGLAQAQVQSLLDAFNNVQAKSEQLASISQPAFDLSRLSETLALLDEAFLEAEKLRDALNGEPNVDVEAATSKLVDLLGQMGDIWTQVGTTIQDGAATWSAEVTDLDGASIGRYRAGEPLRIAVPAARSLTFWVYNAAGDRVAAMGGPRDRLVWRGTNGSGNALPAGTYYYRLRMGNGTPKARVELGEIRIRPSSDN